MDPIQYTWVFRGVVLTSVPVTGSNVFQAHLEGQQASTAADTPNNAAAAAQNLLRDAVAPASGAASPDAPRDGSPRLLATV